MKRVAIIGSKGYIGNHLEYFLRRLDYHVESYDIMELNEDSYCQCNLSDREQIEKINLNVDYIYMFAGKTGTKNGFDCYEDYITSNEISLINLLDAIRKSPYRPKVIFPSSRLIFKGQERPLKEEDEKETKTIYAVNKLACENLLYAYSNMYDIPYTIYRICIPFGNMLAKDYSFGTVGFFIRQAKEKGVITLYGDGRNKRTFTNIGDLCRQIELSVSKGESKNQIYNIGGTIYSLIDAAREIAKHFDATINFIPYPEDDLKIESGSTFFNSTKLEALTGYTNYQKLDALF